MTYDLIATATFGVESIVADELKALGYHDVDVENGRVNFRGAEPDIARCNLWLRTADRVTIRLGYFPADDFGQLIGDVFRRILQDLLFRWSSRSADSGARDCAMATGRKGVAARQRASRTASHRIRRIGQSPSMLGCRR